MYQCVLTAVADHNNLPFASAVMARRRTEMKTAHLHILTLHNTPGTTHTTHTPHYTTMHDHTHVHVDLTFQPQKLLYVSQYIPVYIHLCRNTVHVAKCQYTAYMYMYM